MGVGLLVFFLCGPAEQFPDFPVTMDCLLPLAMVRDAEIYLYPFSFRPGPAPTAVEDVMLLRVLYAVVPV